MAAIAIQQPVLAGLNPSYAACTGGGDTVPGNDGKVMLHVKNGSGGALTVTVASQRPTVAGYTPANNAVSVPAAGERMIGPFDPAAFNDSTGSLVVTYSAVTSLTIAAVRVAN